VKPSTIKGIARGISPTVKNERTTEELEFALGASFKGLRLSRNISQKLLAERAGIGTTALKNLEGGRGATVSTLVRVARALGRETWLENAAPVATINPLNMVQNAGLRQRARSRSEPASGMALRKPVPKAGPTRA